jgi:Phospholipase_D-nuclease N-terminal
MTQRQRWSDLSERSRAAIAAAGVVQVGLMLAALADLRRRPAKQINGSKRLWVAASFVNFAGPIAYFAFGRKR